MVSSVVPSIRHFPSHKSADNYAMEVAMKHIHVRYLLLLVIGILTVHQPIHSQWSTNPNVTTPVCTADQEQDLYGIMSDGVGGVIITWMDSRDYNGDIYAQRMDSAGFIMWTLNGVLISTSTYGQYDPLPTTDGARGAIITWIRSGTSEDIYAQHVNEY